MEIYCTRPDCSQPQNFFPDLDDLNVLKTAPQRHCTNCGMQLILDGRYIPLKLIKSGGFGAIFLGCDRRTPTLKRCAIKQLYNPSFTKAQLEVATRLFKQEAEVLEQLGEHPNIPRFFAFLEINDSTRTDLESQPKFFYLVQHYIEGQDLQVELKQEGKFSQAKVEHLLGEILPVLEFIHTKGAIHRDIKPSNIVRDSSGKLHLIDFGSVKQVVENNLAKSGVTGVFTPEYAPSEQRQCAAIYPSSDLYALAVSCIQLITGKDPTKLFDDRLNTWQWNLSEPKVTPNLERVLNRMLAENPADRFATAEAVLQALASSPAVKSEIDPPTTVGTKIGKKWLLAPILGIVAMAVVGAIAIDYSRPKVVGSTGDRAWIASEGGNLTPRFIQLKESGIAAMKSKNFDRAVVDFQAALKENPNAPETRIYLNNALIGNTKSYTIAIPVPIGEDTNYRALEMLRGFAQAQREINQGKGHKIKLEIFNDLDRVDEGEKIADSLVKQPQILAVVGHNSSAINLAAAKIYNDKKLVFIAPISVSDRLTGTDSPYVFKTNVRSDLVSQQLVGHMVNNLRKKKAAIFYVPNVPYSETLKSQFANKLAAKQGEIVELIDLSSPNFNPSQSLQKAKLKGAEVIALFPTRKYRDRTWNVLRDRDRKKIPMDVLGDIATLYSYDTLQQAGEAAKGMVLGVSWHVAEGERQFSKDSQQLWNASVNWATATSYDALKAAGTVISLDPDPARENVKNALTNNRNSIVGSAGEIKFFNGEPMDKVTLVTVDRTPPNYPYTSGTGYDFLPLNLVPRSPTNTPK
jgi:ABC-type branched-subunit amino acid transport system substrate-binding protein